MTLGQWWAIPGNSIFDWEFPRHSREISKTWVNGWILMYFSCWTQWQPLFSSILSLFCLFCHIKLKIKKLILNSRSGQDHKNNRTSGFWAKNQIMPEKWSKSWISNQQAWSLIHRSFLQITDHNVHISNRTSKKEKDLTA